VNISGSAALVTGGAGGLGEATVRRLAAAGARVVIADLSDDRGAALAGELGSGAVYVRTDATDEASVLAALEAAAEMGPLRVAVNAHGGTAGGQGRVVDRDGNPYGLDDFRRTIELYLVGTYNVLRLAAARMSRQDADENGVRGVIVNTASIAAYEGQIGQTAYAAAKAGVVGLTISSARDLAAAGIRVMTIAPGTFLTPAFRMERADAEQRWGSGVPFPKRMGEPAEYASLVQSICENDYLNGEVIRLDAALRFGPK
jgi:NAD(P)-dependent dehydrogenase (short-subunit alcohol dehydrogenase family)